MQRRLWLSLHPLLALIKIFVWTLISRMNNNNKKVAACTRTTHMLVAHVHQPTSHPNGRRNSQLCLCPGHGHGPVPGLDRAHVSVPDLLQSTTTARDIERWIFLRSRDVCVIADPLDERINPPFFRIRWTTKIISALRLRQSARSRHKRRTSRCCAWVDLWVVTSRFVVTAACTPVSRNPASTFYGYVQQFLQFFFLAADKRNGSYSLNISEGLCVELSCPVMVHDNKILGHKYITFCWKSLRSIYAAMTSCNNGQQIM